MRRKLLALLFAGLMGLGGVACEGDVDVNDGDDNGGVELEGDVDDLDDDDDE